MKKLKNKRDRVGDECVERIVIVEDDVFLREESQNILEKEGYL